MASGSTMFSPAVSVGTRLKDWKTKPISSRRSRVSALSFICDRSCSPISTEPLSAVSSAAQQCMRVDLPEPLGPITAVNSPAYRSSVTSSRARTSGVARAVGLGEVDAPARRSSSCRHSPNPAPRPASGFHTCPPLTRTLTCPRARHPGDPNRCSVRLIGRGLPRDAVRLAAAGRGLPAPATTRTPLARGAWVDVRRDWLADADDVFAAMVHDVPWRAERRQMYDRVVDVPRLVHNYAAGEPLPHPTLEEAREALSAHYRPELGEPFVTAGCCFYRDGRDSVAWHGDRIGRGRPRGHHGRHRVPGRPPPAGAATRAAAARRCRSPWATATCS